jgi:hypothetical protein
MKTKLLVALICSIFLAGTISPAYAARRAHKQQRHVRTTKHVKRAKKKANRQVAQAKKHHAKKKKKTHRR